MPSGTPMRGSGRTAEASGDLKPAAGRLWFGVIALAVVIIDQATKLAVVRSLEIGESRMIIDGIFYLTHVRNPGAAFGLFRGNQGFLAIASLVGVLVFVFIIVRRPTPLVGTGSGLIAGGALGNLADRVLREWPYRGTVVDFMDFAYWPAFNVADAAITTGAGLLILAAFIDHRQPGPDPAGSGRADAAPAPATSEVPDSDPPRPADTEDDDGGAEDRDR